MSRPPAFGQPLIVPLIILGLALSTFALTLPAQTPAPAIDVLHYDVQLGVNFQAHSISGQTTVRFRSHIANLREVSFSGNALRVESARSGGKNVVTQQRGELLTVTLLSPLAIGKTSEITFIYSGVPRRGLTFGPRYVYSSYFACDWMICSQDTPGDKATIRMTLLVPKGMASQGPGTLRTGSTTAAGLEQHIWSEVRPYSSYLFGFAIGEFTKATSRVGPTELVFLSPSATSERLSAEFAPTGAMLRFLQDKAGVPFPHARYVQIQAPGSEAQEAMNFSILGEDVVAPTLTKPDEDWGIAHELAHQWWGNLITCTDWNQFWLNEGITTFMVAAWKEHRWGRAAYDEEMGRLKQRVDAASAVGISVPLTYPGPYPSLSVRRAITYSKGALFMDRLRRDLGDNAFWYGLKEYTRTHAGGIVDSHDLQRSFEYASGRDLTTLFNAWVY